MSVVWTSTLITDFGGSETIVDVIVSVKRCVTTSGEELVFPFCARCEMSPPGTCEASLSFESSRTIFSDSVCARGNCRHRRRKGRGCDCTGISFTSNEEDSTENKLGDERT